MADTNLKDRSPSPVRNGERNRDTSSEMRQTTSSSRRIQRELDRMKQADDYERMRRKERGKEEVQKILAAKNEEKIKKGITITPEVEASRDAIRKAMQVNNLSYGRFHILDRHFYIRLCRQTGRTLSEQAERQVKLHQDRQTDRAISE